MSKKIEEEADKIDDTIDARKALMKEKRTLDMGQKLGTNRLPQEEFDQKMASIKMQMAPLSKRSQELRAPFEKQLKEISALNSGKTTLEKAQAMKALLVKGFDLPSTPITVSPSLKQKACKEHESEYLGLKDAMQVKASKEEERRIKSEAYSAAKDKHCKVNLKPNYKDLLTQQKNAFELKKDKLISPDDKEKWKQEFKAVSAQVKAAKQQMKKEFGISKHELYEMRKEHGKPLGVMERIGAYFAKRSHEKAQRKSGPGKFSKMVNSMRKAFTRQTPKAKSAARGTGQGRAQGQGASR